MSVLYKNSAAADDVSDNRLRCSCLPFCFWRGSTSMSRRTESRGAEAAPGKRHRRRWRRFRLIRLSWLALSWPWLRKSGKKQDCTKTTGKQRRGRRRLLLLKTSLQAQKALASVVSGDSGGLLPTTVSSFGDANKQNRNKPRPTTDGAATTTGTRGSTVPARSGTSQPCKTTSNEPAMAVAGRIWRAPSRRLYSLHQPIRTERPTADTSGLWTAATTLGVIVLFGRVSAVVFLCSCLYGVRFVRGMDNWCQCQEQWRRYWR